MPITVISAQRPRRDPVAVHATGAGTDVKLADVSLSQDASLALTGVCAN